jgi:TonB-linked SusC/RagA family outer membrane protein
MNLIHYQGHAKFILQEKRPSWGTLIKYLAVMKLTLILLMLTLQVSASAWSQQISLNFTKAELQDVLKSIRKQSGFNFVASAKELSKANPVTINLKSNSIDEILQTVFANQPFVYKLEDNIIMISLKTAEKKRVAEETQQQQQDLRGTVRDQIGRPLIGATVYIKETKVGAITNQQGEFLIIDAPENGTLVITMIGHETKEVKFSKSLIATVTLKEVNANLSEVQIIGYGEVQRQYSTSNIGTVNSEQISKQPVSNPLLALQGRVTGLFIQQTSGVTAAPINVTIQGKNSLQKGSDPFYVIDGIPYSPQFTDYSLLGASISGLGGSSFNFLNPADIESISILKDADATAIYGSRAANGAILITTKKGKAGQTKIDVNFQNGWGKIDHKLKYLNTQQYLEVRKEAYSNDGLPIPNSNTTPDESNYDLTIWDQNKFPDWQKILVGGTAQFQSLQASISGGSQNTQFLAGYGFNRQTTVYPDNLGDKKGNVHLNLNHKSANNKFKYMASATYLKDKNQLSGVDLMDAATSLVPNAPMPFNPDGSLNWGPLPKNPTVYSLDNPLKYTKQVYSANTTNLIASNTISYEFISGLTAKVSGGYNKLEADETKITPFAYFKPDLSRKNRTAGYLTKSIDSWIIEPQLTYTRNTKIGAIDALIGSTFQQSKTDIYQQTGSGYTNDAQLGNILAASTVVINNNIKTQYRYDAVFARLNYRYNDKYIINLTTRRDGSSRFGNANKLHTFYALGSAWLFGSEDLIARNLPWLSFGKLRVNYGTTGNDQISDYTYLSLLDNYRTDIPYQSGVSLYPTNLNNPYLQWEETRKLNLGINLGFLKNRIELDVNYFRNRSSNQLVSYLLPITTGFTGITQNFPATIQNKGLEVMLNINPVKSKNFNWQSSLNFTTSKNKLVAFPGLETSSYAQAYVIGEPINVIKAFRFAGVNPTTGLYEFINSKGEKTSDPSFSKDRSVLIDPNPKWYGGISNSFQYKNFQLDFLVQVVNQKAKNNRFGIVPGLALFNQPVEVLDRWKKPGDISNVQKFSTSFDIYTPWSNAIVSDAGYSNGSYMRLKNASLSYNLPTTLLSKVHISNARFYIQGQNLLTITDFVGSDPESKGISYLPPLRMFTVGIQISL